VSSSTALAVWVSQRRLRNEQGVVTKVPKNVAGQTFDIHFIVLQAHIQSFAILPD
jgi:hypothetical protein